MNEKVSQFNKMVIMHLTNPDQICIWKCWFLRRGETRILGV